MQLKRILLLAVMLLPMLLLAQREVVSDTMYLKKTCPTDSTCYFSEVREIAYDDEETVIRSKVIGDSATTVSYLTNRSIDLNRQFAQHAFYVIQKNEMLRAINNDNRALDTMGLPGVFGEIQAKFEADYLGDVQVKIGSADWVNGDVFKAANGTLRVKWTGQTALRVIIYSDMMIRVVGYPATGQNLDLYRIRTGVYTSIDRAVTIKKK